MKNLLVVLMSLLIGFSNVAQAIDITELTAALGNDAGRPEADKARDVGRKPAHVLDFLGILLHFLSRLTRIEAPLIEFRESYEDE